MWMWFFSDMSLWKKTIPITRRMVGLIVLEPCTYVKSMLWFANCAGTPHSTGVYDAGLIVLEFYICVSILST